MPKEPKVNITVRFVAFVSAVADIVVQEKLWVKWRTFCDKIRPLITGDIYYMFNENVLASRSESDDGKKALREHGISEGSTVFVHSGRNPRHGINKGAIVHGSRPQFNGIAFNNFDEYSKFLRPASPRCFYTGHNFVNYIITPYDTESNELHEQFNEVLHSGTSQRVVNLCDRQDANAKGFNADEVGQLVLFYWTNESAQRVGFENAEDAVYGIECLIGEADATLKFDQEPGIQTCSYNVKVYERAKLIPSGREVVFNRICEEKELSEVNTWILEEADAATDAFESILEPKKDIGSKKRKLSSSVYKEQSSSLPTDDRNIQPHIAELLEQITAKLSLSEVADLNYVLNKHLDIAVQSNEADMEDKDDASL